MKTDISLKIYNFTSNNYLKNVSCDRHQHCQSLTAFLTLVMLFNDQQIGMIDLVRCRLQMYIISEILVIPQILNQFHQNLVS